MFQASSSTTEKKKDADSNDAPVILSYAQDLEDDLRPGKVDEAPLAGSDSKKTETSQTSSLEFEGILIVEGKEEAESSDLKKFDDKDFGKKFKYEDEEGMYEPIYQVTST